MDFSVSDKMQHVLGTIHDFVKRELYPLEPAFLMKGFRAIEPELNAARKKVKELGLWAPQVPQELGGMCLTLLEHGMVSEVLGRSPIGHYEFGCQAPDA